MKIPKTSFEIPIIYSQENIINNQEINYSSRMEKLKLRSI